MTIIFFPCKGSYIFYKTVKNLIYDYSSLKTLKDFLQNGRNFNIHKDKLQRLSSNDKILLIAITSVRQLYIYVHACIHHKRLLQNFKLP